MQVLRVTILTIFLLILSAPAAAARADRVRGTATHMGSVPVPLHYAATHHGDSQWTFRQGAVLRLYRGGHTFWVKIQDTCAGSACRMLDLNPAAFYALGTTPSVGVIRVTAYCGRGGHQPMRKCLAGEDQRSP